MNTICNFECPNQLEETLFPTHLFDDRQEVYINLPYCQANEKQSREFLRSLQAFTRGQCKLQILRKTKKAKSLFYNKDKSTHPSQVIYRWTSNCRVSYISETSHNLQECISKHEDTTKFSLNLPDIFYRILITRSYGKSSLPLTPGPCIASLKPYYLHNSVLT